MSTTELFGEETLEAVSPFFLVRFETREATADGGRKYNQHVAIVKPAEGIPNSEIPVRVRQRTFDFMRLCQMRLKLKPGAFPKFAAQQIADRINVSLVTDLAYPEK